MRPQIISCIVVISLSVIVLSGCSGGAGNSNIEAKKANSTANTKPAESPIEISADSLAKEFAADPAAAGTKYKGKLLSVTGSVYLAEKIGGQAYITLQPIAPDAKTKGIRIECVAGPEGETSAIIEGTKLNQGAAGVSKDKDVKQAEMKVTLKGTFSESHAPGDNYGSMTLKPCAASIAK